MHKKPIEILLVEDNPGDVELVQEALAIWATPVKLTIVEDGDKALQYLHRQGAFSSVSIPDLVLLDLNLPRKTGIDVLRDVKNDQELSRVPIIVLTTSDREQDVQRAYSLHANCYLTKPLEIDDFIAKLQAVEKFWFDHVRLPARAHS